MFGVRSRFKRGVECAKGSSSFCLCRILKEFGADHDGCLGDCLNDETNDVKRRVSLSFVWVCCVRSVRQPVSGESSCEWLNFILGHYSTVRS